MLSRTFPSEEAKYEYKAKKYQSKIQDLLGKMEKEGKTIPQEYKKYMKNKQ